MPPQREDPDACEEHAVPSTSESADSTSYWGDAPIDKSLEGKRLSTLDMSALASNHPDAKQEKQDSYWDAPEEEKLKGKRLSTLDMTTLETVEPSKPDPVTVSPDNSGATSYWDDAPIDKALQGKRLSTLDMSALAGNHPDQQKEKQDDYWGDAPTQDEALKGKTLSTLDMSALESNHPDQHQKKKDDYWGDAPIDKSLEGKRLSTLDMTALATNHPDEQKEKQDNYWEAPEEEKLKGKRLSTLDMQTLETVESSSTPAPASEDNSGPASYWDEAPICDGLNGKRLSAVDLEAMSKQKVDDKKAKESSNSYWEWQGMATITKTLSKLSLSNLRKGSAKDVVFDDDDRVHGGTASMTTTESSNSMGSVGSAVRPITSKKHKLRDSWRRSFQRLSTNTLDQLDESTSSGPRVMGKKLFSKKKSRTNPLDWSHGSRSSQGSVGEAIMF